MTSTQPLVSSSVDEVLSENVRVLMGRAGLTQAQLGQAVWIGQTTLSRRLKNESSWLFYEIGKLADYFSVSIDELAGQLPSLNDWRARRDSNPKPSDSESLAVASCPALRLVAGSGADACTPNRHLRAVS